MSHVLQQLDDLIEAGTIHSVFVGKSATRSHSRFATLRTGTAETVATGEGNSAEEALRAAISNIGRPAIVPVQTQPAMPGFTRNAMPGF